MKILIIDDEELKLIYFTAQCENIFNCPEIEVCSTLESANMQLSIFYDIVLCDLKLGNDYSESFVLDYKNQWPKSHVVLYSGNNDSKDDIRGIKIWSSSSVVSGLEDYRRQKKLTKKSDTEIKPMSEPFNKEACDLKHGYLNSAFDEFKKELSGIRSDLLGFRLENSKSSKTVIVAIFVAIITPYLTTALPPILTAILKKIGL